MRIIEEQFWFIQDTPKGSFQDWLELGTVNIRDI